MSIQREKDRLVTKVYRKPTHTQHYIHWRSKHPKNLLLGVLKGLIHRAHELCDLREDLLEELDLLRDVFIANGYPQECVTKTIDKSWNTETLKAILVESNGIHDPQDKQEFNDVLHAPYVQGFSEGLQKKLRKYNVGFVPKKGLAIYNQLCKLKQKPSIEDEKNVVYAIKCATCKMFYFGETSQHFCDRRNQHMRDVTGKKSTNGIFQHVNRNRKHKIAWEEIYFIDYEKNWMARRIKEALYIDAFNPTNKLNTLMNLEKGMKIDNCWTYFADEIRSVASKKLQLAQPK